METIACSSSPIWETQSAWGERKTNRSPGPRLARRPAVPVFSRMHSSYCKSLFSEFTGPSHDMIYNIFSFPYYVLVQHILYLFEFTLKYYNWWKVTALRHLQYAKTQLRWGVCRGMLNRKSFISFFYKKELSIWSLLCTSCCFTSCVKCVVLKDKPIISNMYFHFKT